MRIARDPRTVLFLASAVLFLSNPCALAHTDVTAEQARDLIRSTDDLVVVDVREPSEYCGGAGHIPGALNYPWNSGVLKARYEDLPEDSPILVVCGSGGRSNSAAKFLISKGFSLVYDMLGGMSAWEWETVSCEDPEEDNEEQQRSGRSGPDRHGPRSGRPREESRRSPQEPQPDRRR